MMIRQAGSWIGGQFSGDSLAISIHVVKAKGYFLLLYANP
jgi:hypothetical protein